MSDVGGGHLEDSRSSVVDGSAFVLATVGIAIVTLVCLSALMATAVIIGLCDIGLGGSCTPEEDRGVTLAGYGAIAVLVVAVSGGAWFVRARRRLVLIAVLAFVPALALIAGSTAGVQADRGRCQSLFEIQSSTQTGSRPRCDVVSSFTHAPQATSLVLGAGLAAVAVYAVVVDRHRMRSGRTTVPQPTET